MDIVIGPVLKPPGGYGFDVGGLTISQLLTLFTTPVVYIYLDRLGPWLGRRHAAGAEAGIVVRGAADAS